MKRRTAHLAAFSPNAAVGDVVAADVEKRAWPAQIVAVDSHGDVDVVELLDGEDELPEDWA